MESPAFSKALNALFISSVFLKYLIENTRSDNFEELYLSLDETDPVPNNFSRGCHVQRSVVMFSALSFISKVDVSPGTYHLHQELLNFIVIASSTQLLAGPTPGPNDIHPFIDAAMMQESSLVNMVVHKLLLNYITRPQFPVNSLPSVLFFEANQPSILRRVSCAAASMVLFPFNYLVSSTSEASRSSFAEASLHVLLIHSYYRKCTSMGHVKDKSFNSSSEFPPTEETYFSESPFYKALENVLDVELDRVDVEGNAHSGPVLRLPFASLFDTLGMCLAKETFVLLLYTLVHGNTKFLEYGLVRTDTTIMPMLETLYNAPNRTSNHIFMVLIIFLMLSQDSTFNASIHKLMLPNVPWYKEQLLNQTSLGSLMVIILIRTVKYNLSKLRRAPLLPKLPPSMPRSPSCSEADTVIEPPIRSRRAEEVPSLPPFLHPHPPLLLTPALARHSAAAATVSFPSVPQSPALLPMVPLLLSYSPAPTCLHRSIFFEAAARPTANSDAAPPHWFWNFRRAELLPPIYSLSVASERLSQLRFFRLKRRLIGFSNRELLFSVVQSACSTKGRSEVFAGLVYAIEGGRWSSVE